MKNPLVSIIIPVIELNDYLEESIPEILKLDYPNFEIIILPNEKSDTKWEKTRIIATKTSNPSTKRNIGVKHANGKIIAFLDDDAYPKKDWLKIAIRKLRDKKIVAVGGPAVTPKSDSILQKASGAMSESFIGGGKARNRFISVGKGEYVDDWPSVNLLVKKEAFIATGGFDKRFWPGEDTKLCRDLLNYGKIYYQPKAIVYHHRRASLVKHLRQNGNYGLHRGHFARHYPENSLKLFYLCPSLFVIYLLILAIFEMLIPILHWNLGLWNYVLLFPLALYLLLIIVDVLVISIRHLNPLVGIATIPYIIGTHIYYGIRFIKGYFSVDISASTHNKKSQ